MPDEMSIEQEVLNIAGKFYAGDIYNGLIESYEDARRSRSGLFRKVPSSFDETLSAIIPHILADTLVELFDKLKYNELSLIEPSVRSIVVLSDGTEVSPSSVTDLYYESFGPDGIFAKYAHDPKPQIAEDP